MSDDTVPADDPSAATEGYPLAFASLSFGLISALVCWFPFVGLLAFPSGGLGLILGIAGFAITRSGRRSGLVAAAFGAGLGLVAMIASVVVSWTVADAMFVAIDAANNVPPLPAFQRPAPDPAPPVDPGLIMPPPAMPPPVPDPIPALPPPRPAVLGPAALPMGQAYVLGDFEVRVVRAERGKVSLRPRNPRDRRRSQQESSGEFLSIEIEVRNAGDARKLDYATLAGPKVSLSDDRGNRYNVVDFGPIVVPRGRTLAASIYPGKAVNDQLVFEPPIEGASDLVLSIPAEKAVVGKVFLRFKIPVGSIVDRPVR